MKWDLDQRQAPLWPKREGDLKIRWVWFGRRFTYTKREKGAPMGRFGAGWNFKLGIQTSGSTVIISLGISYLRFDLKRQKKEVTK